MRSLISFLFFLSVFTNSTYANAVRAKRFDLLRDAVFQMVRVPELSGKMVLEHGGVTMTEFVKYLSIHETEVYSLYSERGLRSAVGKAMDKELRDDVFSMLINADGKIIRKYFLGAEPDLKAIISDVIAIPELRAKMEWGDEGLSMDEIMVEVIDRYPEVHTLYMQVPNNETDHGLRSTLGKALDEEMKGDVFSIVINADGKKTLKYFLGAEPDLKAIISRVIDIPELRAKMEGGNEGLSMDEIMLEVIDRYPEVHTLYVQASNSKTDRGLRVVLGRAMDEKLKGNVFSMLIDADGKKILKHFLGVEPDLKAIISRVIDILEANMEGENVRLSVDEIIAEVINLYPEVRTLYVQASNNKTDQGLRIALGKAMGGIDGMAVDSKGYFWKKFPFFDGYNGS